MIEYLKTGWTRPQLLGLFAAADLTPRAALRPRGSPAQELGLLDPGSGDETLVAAMVEHPVLVKHWFRQRLADGKGRMKKVLIVALARKLLIALWTYATQGVLPAGAVRKAARRPGGVLTRPKDRTMTPETLG